MIGKLKGIIDELEKDHLIIDVGGVGYIVFCSSSTLNSMPAIGEAASLVIETHVREDQITLYGFSNLNERNWFRELITVKGVGPKLAQAILGALSPHQLANAIASHNKPSLTQVSGVGPKLVERIFAELKDKEIILLDKASAPAKTISKQAASSTQEDAISALVNLGYSRMDAYNLVTRLITINPESSLSELIKIALKELAK